MDYYQKKAHVEAILREVPPPHGLLGYFRLIKEVYAHNRNDLALSLCNAFVLSRQHAGQDRGAGFPSPTRSGKHCGYPETPSDLVALEAIYTALACSLTHRHDHALVPFIWLHLCKPR